MAWSLGDKRVKAVCLGGGKVGEGRGCAPETGSGLSPPSLELLRVGILGGGVPGEDLSRIFVSFSGVVFQGHGLH